MRLWQTRRVWLTSWFDIVLMLECKSPGVVCLAANRLNCDGIHLSQA